MLGVILLFTFLASILSLFLVALFLVQQKLMRKISFQLVSFAAGALLATGFTDTMPEAVSRSSYTFIAVTIFISIFFLIERAFLHLHHHEAEEGEETMRLPLPLLLFGDGLHNFIDGLSIAATFAVAFPLGLVTSVAVFVHEIPHELGDFGILLHMGYKRGKVLGFNILTGVFAIMGAVIGYILQNRIEGVLPILLALTSANFIYLSLSDLLPEIHDKAKGRAAFIHTFTFFLGVIFIIILEHFFKA